MASMSRRSLFFRPLTEPFCFLGAIRPADAPARNSTAGVRPKHGYRSALCPCWRARVIPARSEGQPRHQAGALRRCAAKREGPLALPPHTSLIRQPQHDRPLASSNARLARPEKARPIDDCGGTLRGHPLPGHRKAQRALRLLYPKPAEFDGRDRRRRHRARRAPKPESPTRTKPRRWLDRAAPEG